MKHTRPSLIIAILSLLLLLAPGISAQTMGSAIPGAITVSGEGSASAPAEEAMVVITLGTDGSMFYDPVTGMPKDDVDAMEIDATPIVDAMVAHGIPADAIEIADTPFTGEWGSGNMPMPVMILVTIPQPTVEELASLLEVVREAATAEGVFLNQFGVMYSVADCRPLRQEARANAVADARMEADDQAAVLDTTVGAVVASKDVMPISMGAFQPNSCSTGYPMKPYDSMYMTAGFDPRLPAEVSVTVALEVSYQLP